MRSDCSKMKLMKHLVNTVIILGFLFQSIYPVNAKSLVDEKDLEANHKYSYDLDGDGVKEKIIYTSELCEDTYGESIITLTINGKKVFKKKGLGFQFFVYICDIDTDDNYKELVIKSFGGDNYMSGMDICHYRKGKIKTLYTYNDSKVTDLYLDFGIGQTDGKGNFIWTSGCLAGLYDYCELKEVYEGVPVLGSIKNIAFELKKNQIQLKKVKSYQAYEGPYKAKKQIKVYKKADVKSGTSFYLKANEEFKIDRIVYLGKKKALLRVTNSSGEEGWIYVRPGVGVIMEL